MEHNNDHLNTKVLGLTQKLCTVQHYSVQLNTATFSRTLQRFLEQHSVYLTPFVSSEFLDLSRISLRSNGVNEDTLGAAVDLQHEQNSQ